MFPFYFIHLTVSVKFARKFLLDYSFLSKPAFSSGFMETYHKVLTKQNIFHSQLILQTFPLKGQNTLLNKNTKWNVNFVVDNVDKLFMTINEYTEHWYVTLQVIFILVKATCEIENIFYQKMKLTAVLGVRLNPFQVFCWKNQ